MALVLKIEKLVVKDQYRVKFTFVSLGDQDVELMNKHGDVLVNFGGTYVGDGGFNLPDKLLNLRTLSYQQSFDKGAIPTAEIRATAYDTETQTKIETAMDDLRTDNLPDNFTSDNNVTFE